MNPTFPMQVLGGIWCVFAFSELPGHTSPHEWLLLAWYSRGHVGCAICLRAVIIRRIFANNARGTATSASWNVT